MGNFDDFEESFDNKAASAADVDYHDGHKVLVRVQEGGTRWRCWLRHCATSRKVAGSISDGVIGIFH
jgi:hypothetical protein